MNISIGRDFISPISLNFSVKYFFLVFLLKSGYNSNVRASVTSHHVMLCYVETCTDDIVEKKKPVIILMSLGSYINDLLLTIHNLIIYLSIRVNINLFVLTGLSNPEPYLNRISLPFNQDIEEDITVILRP